MIKIVIYCVRVFERLPYMNAIDQSGSRERPRVAEGSWLEIVRRQVASLEFGIVQIVVHGSRVVQIDRTEKVRLQNPIAVSSIAD
jgi:hypothetical protein